MIKSDAQQRSLRVGGFYGSMTKIRTRLLWLQSAGKPCAGLDYDPWLQAFNSAWPIAAMGSDITIDSFASRQTANLVPCE